jgi:hypothetical protein
MPVSVHGWWPGFQSGRSGQDAAAGWSVSANRTDASRAFTLNEILVAGTFYRRFSPQPELE